MGIICLVKYRSFEREGKKLVRMLDTKHNLKFNLQILYKVTLYVYLYNTKFWKTVLCSVFPILIYSARNTN